jgi:Rieske Fe-S protein
LIGSVKKGGASAFVPISDVNLLSRGVPKKVIFSEWVKDAFILESKNRDAWVVKNSAEDITVFSPICPHLGCSYNWQQGDQHFVCPCHGSVFDKDGKVISGPAPRGLDTLPNKVEKGKLYVEWERFEVGIPEKKII